MSDLLLLLSPFLIYFPRLAPGIETQPWLVFLLSGWALLIDPRRRGWQASVLILVSFFLFSVIAMLLGSASPSAGLSSMQLAFGPLILCGVTTWRPDPPSRAAVATIAVLLSAIALFEVADPTSYAAVAGLLLDRVTVANGQRGISLLAPEPTYAALAVVYALLLAMWSRRFWGARHAWVEWLLVVLLGATFSTYALVLLVALAFMIRPKAMLVACILAVAFLQGLASSEFSEDGSVRAVVAVYRLLSVDWTAFLPSLSLVDPSLGYRFITLSAGFSTTLFAPFGYGLGCDSLVNAFDKLGWDFTFTDAVLGPELYDGCLKPSSFLSAALLSYGVLALPLLGLLIALVRRVMWTPVSRPWWAALAVALLILTIQCQMTNPVPWMIIYMALWRPTRSVVLHRAPASRDILRAELGAVLQRQ